MTRLDQLVLEQVLANEWRCRQLLRSMAERGVHLSVPIDSLTHDECIYVAREILAELERRENLH